MNKSYRTVWNEALGAWVAASEITKARGKRSRSGVLGVTTAVLLALGGAGDARAQALGGGVVPVPGGTAISAGVVDCGSDVASAAGAAAIAIGCAATATQSGQSNIAVGGGALASSSTGTGDQIAIGRLAQATGGDSIAIGGSAIVLGTNSIAIGGNTSGITIDAASNSSLAFGDGATIAKSVSAVAVGGSATVTDAQNGVAVGFAAKSFGSGGTAIGAGSGVGPGAVGAVAVGNNANSSNIGSIAIGGDVNGKVTTSSGLNSISIGVGTNAAGLSSLAIGTNTIVNPSNNGSGSAAIGFNNTIGSANNAFVLGSNVAVSDVAVSSKQGAVSVGSPGNERQITNVAGGTEDTDAVNVRQLRAVAVDGGVRYDQNADGTTNYNNVTMGNGQAPNGTRISNVAPGFAGTDAVNVNQLNATNSRIENVARTAYAGVASAMATQMPGTYVPGKTVMRVGTAVFKGESAVGISFRRTAENNGWSVTGGVGMSRAGVAATVGAEWVFN